MGNKGVPHRKWSKDEKLKIVKEHLEQHESIKALGKKYSVQHNTISRWVQAYIENGEDALEAHSGNPYSALHTSKHLSEVERLRLLVAKQEVEIARLKKGYYVEGVGVNKLGFIQATAIRPEQMSAIFSLMVDEMRKANTEDKISDRDTAFNIIQEYANTGLSEISKWMNETKENEKLWEIIGDMDDMYDEYFSDEN